MRRLSVENIILLHQKLIDQTDGSHGVRDMNLVESAIIRAFATFVIMNFINDLNEHNKYVLIIDGFASSVF